MVSDTNGFSTASTRRIQYDFPETVAFKLEKLAVSHQIVLRVHIIRSLCGCVFMSMTRWGVQGHKVQCTGIKARVNAAHFRGLFWKDKKRIQPCLPKLNSYRCRIGVRAAKSH